MSSLPPLGDVPFHLSVLSTGSMAIDAKHAAVAGILRDPTGDHQLIVNPNPVHFGDRPGVLRDYERGAIYWSESSGAHEQHGPIFFGVSGIRRRDLLARVAYQRSDVH